MSPQNTCDLLETISIISIATDKPQKNPNKEITKKTLRRPSINFYLCGLKNGDELTYVDDPTIKAYVYNEHKANYNDKITSLSSIVKSIKNVKAINGPAYFLANGESLIKHNGKTINKHFIFIHKKLSN